MDLSIIIPTLNEAEYLGRLLKQLKYGEKLRRQEILVVDGGSNDRTREVAQQHSVRFLQSAPGRAIQLNYGAARAEGEILYFLHADTLPPASFKKDIADSLAAGYHLGCYPFRLDSSNPLLRINSYMTRFRWLWCRGGDQSLFVLRSVFDSLKGFREDMKIMEEYDFLERAMKSYRFRIMPGEIGVSARKYAKNGYIRVQLANLVAFNMYRRGYDSSKILQTYKQMLSFEH